MDLLKNFSRSLVVVVLLAAAQGWAATSAGKVERIGPVTAAGASEAVKGTVDEKGYRVTLNDGWTAEFWFAKSVPQTEKDAPGALYAGLTNAEFVGVINLPNGMSDFRGQAIPAGAYTLRYQYLPQDANHMGVSPNPDFLMAIPLASDANPEAKYLFRKFVALSSQTTGAHPAVIAMESAGEPGTVVEDEQKMVVFTVEVGDAAGKKSKLGIVLKGQATQ